MFGMEKTRVDSKPSDTIPKNFSFYAANLKYDLPASIVVFLVATPLCLGIAMASGAPLFSGIIAGIVGGIIVGSLSKSQVGVSGPAAGLAVIVFNAISSLGTWEIFLMAVVLSGVFQVILGFVRAGIVRYYFPSSVIKGMLAGIGLIIILKQIPHAFGYDKVPEGLLAFSQPDSQNTFSTLFNLLGAIELGALCVTAVSLAILISWEKPWVKQSFIGKWLQGPLVAVSAGIVLNMVFANLFPTIALGAKHLVQIPVASSFDAFVALFTLPDFTALANPRVYSVAIVLAVVASLETLLWTGSKKWTH